MSYRADKLAHELRMQISLILGREMRDPRVGFVTVTDVRLSSDLRYARVFVSVLGSVKEQQQTLVVLNEAASYIRRILSSRVRLRHSPELTFIFDESVESGARIEQVLEEVKNETPGFITPSEIESREPTEH